MTPLEYLRRIADWVGRHEPSPLTWAHVVFVSLNTAISHSAYKAEPLLRFVRDELRARVLDRLRSDPGMPGLRDEDLVRASSSLADYERGRKAGGMLQDRYLRWLSDRPNLDDWTLGVWREIVDEAGLEPEHFDGGKSWSSIAPRPTPARPAPTEGWQDALNRLVGLQRVKRHVGELQSFLEVETLRRARGLPANKCSLHHVFLGNPGTGKTSVARILAQIYREFGFLSKGHLVEVDRSGLVAPYVGQTEERTDQLIKSALGGVLFIDEAYSLARGGAEDFGGRAVDTLVKRMEDFRDDLVVIVAGYAKEMEEFIRSNPGLRSRFDSYIEFEDYSDDELLEIFRRGASAASFTAEETTLEAVRGYLLALREQRGRDFGNAREVRTLWEATLRRQARRLLVEREAGRDIDRRLTTLAVEDVPSTVGGAVSGAVPRHAARVG